MPSFSFNKGTRAPFGKNQYLRSTDDVKIESYTFYAPSMPATYADGVPRAVTNKALTSNVATLTATAHGFAVGDTVYVNIGDAVFDGTYVITAVTANTFDYARTNANVASTAATGTATGATSQVTKVLQPGTVIAKITSGGGSGMVGVFQAGAADGRQTAANIVGVADTFAPWELNVRDLDIGVTYEATCVQAWCFEYNAAGQPIALTNTTRDAIYALPQLALLFK